MTKDFSAEEYLALLRTYPDHMALPEQVAEGLFMIATPSNNTAVLLTVFYTVDMELGKSRRNISNEKECGFSTLFFFLSFVEVEVSTCGAAAERLRPRR